MDVAPTSSPFFVYGDHLSRTCYFEHLAETISVPRSDVEELLQDRNSLLPFQTQRRMHDGLKMHRCAPTGLPERYWRQHSVRPWSGRACSGNLTETAEDGVDGRSPPGPHASETSDGDLAKLSPINPQGPRHDSTLSATLASTSAGPRILLPTTERSRPQLDPIMPAPAESVCEPACIACIRL